MAERRCRPFTLIDAMILVAATGFALAEMRDTQDSLLWFLENLFRSLTDPALRVRDRLQWGLATIREMSPLFASWSVASLVLRMRRPRPTVRRIARQPGFVFPLAISATLAVTVLQNLVDSVKGWTTGRATGGGFLGPTDTDGACGAILAVAALMTAGRLWRPEPGWLDKLGWGLALWWLVDQLLFLVYIWL